MSGQDIRETYLEAGEYFGGVIDQVDIDGWDEPALGEWCVRDLAGHTYRSFTTVLSYSDKPAEKVELERPVDYFLKAFESLADPKMVAERGPGLVFHEDAFLAADLLSFPFDLAGVKHLGETGGGR